MNLTLVFSPRKPWYRGHLKILTIIRMNDRIEPPAKMMMPSRALTLNYNTRALFGRLDICRSSQDQS